VPKKPDPSQFAAPVVRFDPAPPDDAADRFEPQLLGFCVTARLDQDAHSRTWWADRLGISRSHMVKMAAEPTLAFVEQLDLALADEKSGQRLRPRLSDLYGDVRPDHRADNPQPVLEWLARDPSMLEHRPIVANALLRSEVALTRCRIRGKTHGIEDDTVVERSLQDLLRLASGPYGGSTVAHQRCAEIALLVPETFFRAITRHFDRSPVGFRLLRTLDRFVNVWRRRESDPDMIRMGRGRIDTRLASLLRRLGHASMAIRHLDPYPGAEWSNTLARDCLRTGRELKLARDWLQSTYDDVGASDRERLYAAWARVSHSDEETKESQAVQTLLAAESPLLRRWGLLFTGTTRLRELSTEQWTERARDAFEPEARFVDDATARHITDPSLEGVRKSLNSVIFAALVTPDGRLRRNLVEAVTAAGLVAPTAAVLLDVYHAEENAHTYSGIREAVIFFLSRLRQPSDDVIALFLRAAAEKDPFVAHVALWGLGDLFGVGEVNRIPDLLDTLGAIARSPDGSSPARVRIAATHALAVIAKNLPATHENQAVVDGGMAVVQVLRRVSETQRQSGVGRIISALSEWGERMNAGKDLIDPTKLGAVGLLGDRKERVT
jgi:hypothetical protein